MMEIMWEGDNTISNEMGSETWEYVVSIVQKEK